MHWYVDDTQLPLEKWCIYNGSVYKGSCVKSTIQTSLNQKIILYFHPVLLSDDPMGHTQSTSDKQSSEKPSERVIMYLICFMC